MKRRQKQQKGQQGGGGQQPLIPPIAELLMLRAMQTELNQQVGAFVAGGVKPGELSEEQREILSRLAHRQGLLKDVWNRFMAGLGVR